MSNRKDAPQVSVNHCHVTSSHMLATSLSGFAMLFMEVCGCSLHGTMPLAALATYVKPRIGELSQAARSVFLIKFVERTEKHACIQNIRMHTYIDACAVAGKSPLCNLLRNNIEVSLPCMCIGSVKCAVCGWWPSQCASFNCADWRSMCSMVEGKCC